MYPLSPLLRPFAVTWEERERRLTVVFCVSACSPEKTNIVIVAHQAPGLIPTPEFPDGHRSTSCIWKIQAPSDFRLAITIETLKFKEFDDYLVIRDGDSGSSPLFGKYGPCASGSVTLFSSGRSVFLEASFPVFSSTNELKIAYRTTNPGKTCLELFFINYKAFLPMYP